MVIALTVLFTLASISWSLWIRRMTWNSRWEVAATLNLLLQGLGMLLISPLASETLGRFLHQLTGEWNLEDYIGHDCSLVAGSAIVYHILGRLGTDETHRKVFNRWVERPMTVAIPVMLALFSEGNAVRIYRPNFLDMVPDRWLDAYWTVLCASMIYLLGFAIRTLLFLRDVPGSRRAVNRYIAAAALGIACCLLRIATTWDLTLERIDGGVMVWTLAGASGVAFALASAQSWIEKSRLISRQRRKEWLNRNAILNPAAVPPNGENSHLK